MSIVQKLTAGVTSTGRTAGRGEATAFPARGWPEDIPSAAPCPLSTEDREGRVFFGDRTIA